MKKIMSIGILMILFLSTVGGGQSQSSVKTLEMDNHDFLNVTTDVISIPQNEEVYIYRDVYGVPHIYGTSNRAMFFGDGYAQAEDHLEQMLINYRSVQGTLSEVFGKDYLESDKEMRLLRVAETVEEKYNDLSFEAQEAVDAFAQGINYYMETHPEETPDWATSVTPQEVVAWGKMVSLSRPYRRLKDDIQRWPGHSISIGDENTWNEEYQFASNEWVVAADKTVDGYVMVQTDPHLPWFGANSWYEVHLVGPDYNVAGATVWGVPGVMMGHNDRIAWALTANDPDTADAYLETINPSNPHQYLYDGEWVDMKVVKETIKIAGENPVEVELLYTHHGPIFYQDENIAISGKMSTWEDIGPTDQVLAYNRARNLEDFMDALRMRQHVRWNHVYGDVDGNIFYIWNARVFHRQGNYDYTMPVDGSTSATEWGDLVSLEDLPQELNPESKFFQNCNTAPWYVNPLTEITKGDYPNYVCPGDTFTPRGIRASSLLDADWDLTVKEMKDISFDTYSLYGEVLIPLLLYSYEHEGNNVSDPNGLLPQAIDVIESWDYKAEASSDEVALARLWIEDVKGIGIDLLNPPTPEDLTVQYMREALVLLINEAQTMLDTYGSLTIPWGEIHILKRGNQKLPLNGAGHILTPLHMAHGPIDSNGVMSCDAGSSYLMLIQLSDPVRAWSVFPLSESNDPNSPHYADISELYSNKQYKPAWFTKQEILANLDPVEPNPVIISIPSENNPPYAPDIDGRMSGRSGKEYTYDFFTTDPEGDEIYYYIMWGDGDIEEWIGPYDSGEEITVKHTWMEKGTYTIKVKAKDSNGAESEWTTLEVSMPLGKHFFSGNIMGLTLFQRVVESHPFLEKNMISDNIKKDGPHFKPMPVYDSPDDLFDMDMEKSLTLEDLGWHQISEKTLENGVVVTVGTWNAGMFNTFNSNGDPQTIQLDEKAAIYWPPNYPDTPNSQAGFGHVYAVHVDDRIDKSEPEILAEVFEIPILQHGENPNDWTELGFKGRDEMIGETFQNLIKVNPCEPVDLTRGNFGWALARTNIRAITLLQRLAEERGGTVTKIALRGGSKEGFATWLTSAVDDRVVVDGSGGYHLEDLETGFPVFGKDWGCEGTGPGGASVEDILLSYDWLLHSPAGEATLKTQSIGRFHEQLKPRFFLIFGDVTRYNMHDGHYYPLGCETPFLDNFTSHPWRYDRVPNYEREDLSVRGVRVRALLLEQLINGPDYHLEVYPKVTSTTVETNGRSFQVTATVNPEPEHVRLWWSHSDDRVWNDEDNAPFEEVQMTKNGDIWVSPWVEAPENEEVAWYVEAENTLVIKSWELPRRDASPVRFLWRLPEVGCEIEAPEWCEPPPDTPVITGPINGKTGKRYKYMFTTTDPDGDDVYYYIDWGDNTVEEWIGPYPSGDTVTVNHTWNKKGTYIIRAKAKNSNSVESSWGTLEISMTKNQCSFVCWWREMHNRLSNIIS